MTAHCEAYINDELGEHLLDTRVQRLLEWFFDYGPKMSEECSQLWMRRESSNYVVAWVVEDGHVWHYQPMTGAVDLGCVYDTSDVDEIARVIGEGISNVKME